MKTVMPIQTPYQGYRFRSRLEARWATFFTKLGVKWEYEKEGYPLVTDHYLPDFWLPGLSLWVEIKGALPNEREKQLLKELSAATNSGAVLFHGMPLENAGLTWCFDCTDGSAGDQWWEVQWAVTTDGTSLCLDSKNDWSSREFLIADTYGPFPAMKLSPRLSSQQKYFFRRVGGSRSPFRAR